MKTRDIDIRNVLHRELDQDFAHDINTLILDELGLCQGEARIDVAVINGSIHGYEIKSERDTLERLPNQVDIYNKVLDTVTVITTVSHIDGVLDVTPQWWGIQEVQQVEDDVIGFVTIRHPKLNPCVDPYSLVQLLWRDEALFLLQECDLARGYLSKGRKQIWKQLAENIPLDELKYHVRRTLKARQNWRSG